MSNSSPLGKTARSPGGRIIRLHSPLRPMTPPVRRFPPPVRRFPPRRDGGKRGTGGLKMYRSKEAVPEGYIPSNSKTKLSFKSLTKLPKHGFKKSKSQSRRR